MKKSLTDIELYKENCPTDLCEHELIREAVNIIITTLDISNRTTGLVKSSEYDRKAAFGRLIVDAIEIAVAEHREEYESDIAMEEGANNAYLPARG